MTTYAAAGTETMSARSPEDVLAAVPVVLGFVPEESVVMLTFGAEHTFHARLDLPLSSRERRDVAGALFRPAERHGVRRALFVLYTAEADRARQCARTLHRAFTGGGIDVVDVLRADGRRWFVVPLGSVGAREGPGVPYDVSGHPFTARSVASGRVTLSSRAELAATVAADASVCVAVAAAELAAPLAGSTDEGAWVRATLGRWAAGLGPPDPPTTKRLLVALREAEIRDAVLAAVDREGAERQLSAWSALVRSAPADLVAPAASVLAFLAWLAGHGALAWCALERAADGDPPCSLAEPVARALEQALPPALWERR